jgi:hypothetical protein
MIALGRKGGDGPVLRGTKELKNWIQKLKNTKRRDLPI